LFSGVQGEASLASPPKTNPTPITAKHTSRTCKGSFSSSKQEEKKEEEEEEEEYLQVPETRSS
jgi:hypothetical protein